MLKKLVWNAYINFIEHKVKYALHKITTMWLKLNSFTLHTDVCVHVRSSISFSVLSDLPAVAFEHVTAW